MLSQAEALDSQALPLDATPIQIAIPVGIEFSMVNFGPASPSGAGVTAGGTIVNILPGSYALNFTLSGDTFSSTSSGITLGSLASDQPVTVTTDPNTRTTATINVTNDLAVGDPSVSVNATFHLTNAGPQDPTIVNDPPQG